MERALHNRLSAFAFRRGTSRGSPGSLVHGDQSPYFGWEESEKVDEAIEAKEEKPQVPADEHGQNRLEEGNREHRCKPDNRTPVAPARGVEEKMEDGRDQDERI